VPFLVEVVRIPSAKFGELGPHFDKISSQSSYESNEDVHLEPEKYFIL
jgi:hypothetical protein